jgi:hypothetical protein
MIREMAAAIPADLKKFKSSKSVRHYLPAGQRSRKHQRVHNLNLPKLRARITKMAEEHDVPPPLPAVPAS